MTKKAATLLLAASLAVSVCAMPVFAADPPSTPVMGSQEVKYDGTGYAIGTAHTQVLYKVTEGYTWTVPVTIDFGADAGVNNTSTVNATLGKDGTGKTAVKDNADNKWKGSAPKVMVTKNVIGADKTLKIAVSTDAREGVTIDGTGFYVETSDKKEKLYFKIQKNDTAMTELTKDNNEVLSVPSGTDTDEQELVFTLQTASNNTEGNAAEKAGKYEGYVIFSSSLV